MSAFIHPQAICESNSIGTNTRIWAFAHVLPLAVIGEDTNVCDGVFIENDVIVGDRVTIKCGVQLWDGIRIANDVFIGPNVTFTNDKFPRSRQWQENIPQTLVESGVSIGANATILPGITLGRGCMVGAGSVVTKSIPPYAIVYGNPARIHGYTQDSSNSAIEISSEIPPISSQEFNQDLPGNCKLLPLKSASDARGDLVAIDFADFLSFDIKRIFFVHNVPTNHVRGEHAHHKCSQFLIAMQGKVHVLLDDGTRRMEVILESPKIGLLIPPMVWATEYKFSEGAILQVLASHPYEPQDYIRSYSEFTHAVGKSTRDQKSVEK